MPESLTSPRRIAAVERQRQALELRIAGATYQQIADTLGWKHRTGAAAAVEAALKKTLQEPADQVRQLDIERLDRMLLALWPQVKQGSYGAHDRILRIMERRAKLLGLDAPTKQEIEVRDIDRTIECELANLAAGRQIPPLESPAGTEPGG